MLILMNIYIYIYIYMYVYMCVCVCVQVKCKIAIFFYLRNCLFIDTGQANLCRPAKGLKATAVRVSQKF